VSQTGAAAVVHWALLVHPATQRPVGPHTGIAPPFTPAQSVFPTHWTQVPVDVSQTGVLPTQAVALLAVHCTHVCVVLSQTGRLVEQAPGPLVVPGMQPTHAPVVVSHTPSGHVMPPSVAHDAWHRFALGEQMGVPPEHSALETHCTQACVVVSQCGAFAVVQLVSERQHAGPGLAHAGVEVVLVDEPVLVVPVVVLVKVVVPPSGKVDVTTVVPVVVVTDPVDVEPDVEPEPLPLVLPLAASGTSLKLGELPPHPCATTSAQPNAQGAITSHNRSALFMDSSPQAMRRCRTANSLY
jgi:hypothetical protein